MNDPLDRLGMEGILGDSWLQEPIPKTLPRSTLITAPTQYYINQFKSIHVQANNSLKKCVFESLGITHSLQNDDEGNSRYVPLEDEDDEEVVSLDVNTDTKTEKTLKIENEIKEVFV